MKSPPLTHRELSYRWMLREIASYARKLIDAKDENEKTVARECVECWITLIGREMKPQRRRAADV